MKTRTWVLGLAALVIAATTLVAPAEARDRWDHHRGNNHWQQCRDNHRHFGWNNGRYNPHDNRWLSYDRRDRWNDRSDRWNDRHDRWHDRNDRRGGWFSGW